jgi:hypothetical protein
MAAAESIRQLLRTIVCPTLLPKVWFSVVSIRGLVVVVVVGVLYAMQVSWNPRRKQSATMVRSAEPRASTYGVREDTKDIKYTSKGKGKTSGGDA